MPTVVGISLRTAGKVYYFDPGDQPYHPGERVMVETARGVELGTVRQAPHEVSDTSIVPPLKVVVRRANTADYSREVQNREREAFALTACQRQIERLGLQMRLIDAQYTFDGSHVLIHFLAESRVDFRELVRELARELRTRIELRQVGVRDEAKLIGGYGICGRPFCCSTFLNEFAPVAISMAKEQGLALNPQKISGMCGRLMCCLAFEHAHYKTVRADMPRLNMRVETPNGVGKVTKVNVLSRQVEVTIPDAPVPVWFAVDDVHPADAGAPVTPCCAQHKAAACGGGCGHGRPNHEVHEAAVAGDVVEPAPTEDAEAQSPRRRRRRKKPGMTATTSTPGDSAPMAQRPPHHPTQQPINHAATPGPLDAGTPVAVDGTAKNKTAPSGRYRPRRRPPHGGNTTQ